MDIQDTFTAALEATVGAAAVTVEVFLDTVEVTVADMVAVVAMAVVAMAVAATAADSGHQSTMLRPSILIGSIMPTTSTGPRAAGCTRMATIMSSRTTFRAISTLCTTTTFMGTRGFTISLL